MENFSVYREEFKQIEDIETLIASVRLKLSKSKLDLKNSVERWRSEAEIEGKHTELRERGDELFTNREFSKALHCYR